MHHGMPLLALTPPMKPRFILYFAFVSTPHPGYCAMAADTYPLPETTSAGVGFRWFDDESPSHPEASTSGRLSQKCKTRLWNTLHNTPARPGRSDRRTELFGHCSPTRDSGKVRHRPEVAAAPGQLGLRARDWDDERDQDIPVFTPLPPPRLLVPPRPGQSLHEDRASTPTSPAFRVSRSPRTWSPLFRPHQHDSPTKGKRAPVLQTSYHDCDFETNSRIEEWLENVRPNRGEAKDLASSLRNLHFNEERRDSLIEPDDHVNPQANLPFDHYAYASMARGSTESLHSLPPAHSHCTINHPGHTIHCSPSRNSRTPNSDRTQLRPGSPYWYSSPSPVRRRPHIFPPPCAILTRQTPLTPHRIPQPSPTCTHRRHPGTAFSASSAHVTTTHPPYLLSEEAEARACNRRYHEAMSSDAHSLYHYGVTPPQLCPSLSQPCITLSPPPPPPQQLFAPHQHHEATPTRLVHPPPPIVAVPAPTEPGFGMPMSRRRPRQRGPAPMPRAMMEANNGDTAKVPVTPKSAARRSRFNAGGDEPAKLMLSPDVYLWRGDSERRARFRETIRERCASYSDSDVVGERAGEGCKAAVWVEESS